MAVVEAARAVLREKVIEERSSIQLEIAFELGRPADQAPKVLARTRRELGNEESWSWRVVLETIQLGDQRYAIGRKNDIVMFRAVHPILVDFHRAIDDA